MLERISKTQPVTGVSPNLDDYERVARTFTWEAARESLDGLPGGGLNIAFEAVVRHARGSRGGRTAIRFLPKVGPPRDITYAALDQATARFANALHALGVQPGERVFSVLGRVPELYVAALGTLRAGAVFCPLFSAFGPEPIATRLALGGARVLVTTSALFERKLVGVAARVPSLAHVVVLGDSVPKGTLAWSDTVERARSEHDVAQTRPETPALLHFTSGTTGTPKGALHVHEAVVMHHMTGRYALDFHDDDVYWCTADPGWVTGTSYGIVAPLTCGITMIVDEAELDIDRWYDTLARERVTVFYTAPTAIRMLMRAGAEPAKKRDLSSLRFMASVGEPLNPEAVVWSNEVFGRPFHDNWWQTETGGIVIANFASMEVRPGSMGKPLPGVRAFVVKRGEDGKLEDVTERGEVGELALAPGWPSMFRAYLNAPERYAKCFEDGYYLSGDLARCDAEGYFWFIGRADDVIKTAGHLVGPFEVESVLIEHPAVAEAAVIGVPDDVAGQVIKAFVALRTGFERTEALEREILAHARKRLGPAVAPRILAFSDGLPRTRSGKILRRLLRARELGLPEGDLSTLEGGSA